MKVTLSEDLPEITPEIFTSASAIIGIRGSGKTNDGVVLAEQAISYGVPVAVIDPTGVWFGLKSSADGKSAGLPVYVFGGQHGDVPLDEHAGAIVARFVVDKRVSIVLDVSLMRKGAQRRFVADFTEALYDLKATKREPLLVIYDEVARFCPQRVEGDVARCVGAVEDIVSLGRSRGLGCALIGQRPATINKTVLTQADNLFAMRTVGTPDRKALDEWVTESAGDKEQRDELVRNLATLKQGEGFFWSPALFGIFRRVKFAARTTFDSSRTPKVGEKHVEPTAFAAVDLEALRGEISASIEKAKADDPKALRARIAQLESASGTVERVVERVEIPVVSEQLMAALRDTMERFEYVAATIRGDFQAIESAIAQFENTEIPPIASAEGAHQDVRERRSGGRSIGKRLPVTAAAQTSPPTLPRSSSSALGGGPLKILEALAGARDGRATRTQLGFLSGYAASGGSFGRYMSTLRSLGLVSGDGSMIVITDEGRAIAGTPSAVTTVDVHAMWRSKLKAGSLKMFDALVSVWPKGMTREQLGAATGYEAAGGSFGRYLSTLSGQDIIERRGAVIVISDALFPTGAIR